MEGFGLKILQVGTKCFPPNHGGVEKIVYDLVTHITQVESHVLCEWEPSQSLSNVHQLPGGLLAQRRFVRRYVREHGISIVHFHKETFIPLALLLRLGGGFSTVLTIHGCAWRLKRWSLPVRSLFFVLDCLACLLIRHVIFVGKRDQMFFARLFPWKTLNYIPNGVVLDGQTVSAMNGTRKGWAYLGRLSPEKNIINLIKAAEEAGIDLDIYGAFDPRDTVYRDQVMKTMATTRYSRLMGPVPFEQVLETLKQYEVFINVSYSEGLPVSVLEAAGAELFLVLSDIPQHRHLGMPCCVYLDPDRLNLRHALGMVSNGRRNAEHVCCEFGLDRMVQSYEAVYREAVP